MLERPKRRDYIKSEMTEAGWNNQDFLTEEDLVTRWKLNNQRVLRNFIQGRNVRGIKLPSYRFGAKTRRFRPLSVLEFEWEVLETN
jgi:hypothetical protein